MIIKLECGTIDGNKIPCKLLDEVKEKSKELTYDLDCKKYLKKSLEIKRNYFLSKTYTALVNSGNL